MIQIALNFSMKSCFYCKEFCSDKCVDINRPAIFDFQLVIGVAARELSDDRN